jgi:ribosome-associated protein
MLDPPPDFAENSRPSRDSPAAVAKPMSDDHEEYERPSKSARKRESESLQELGEALIDMPDSVFDALPLPENLRDAVLAARTFTSHGAQLRQRQYIGKLMRKIDVAPVRAAIEQLQEARRTDARRFKRIESWRHRIIREGESAVKEFCAAYPDAQASELSRLASEARAQAEQKQPPRSARQLFDVLRVLLAARPD